MSIVGTCTQNIPNQTSFFKKIDKNPCAFLVSKVAFDGTYDQYKGDRNFSIAKNCQKVPLKLEQIEIRQKLSKSANEIETNRN